MTRPSPVVFLDAGDTLVSLAETLPRVLAREAAAEGVSLEAAAIARIPALTRMRLRQRATIRRPFSFPAGESRRFWTGLYLEALRGRCALATAMAIAERVYACFSSPAAYAVHEDVEPALSALASAGVRLGVISNWEAWLGELLAYHGLDHWLTWVIASAEVEVEKPDRRIFDLAAARSGHAPRDLLYVGDNPGVDVEGARLAGWQAILLERVPGNHPPDGAPRIRSLHELPTLLETFDAPPAVFTASAAYRAAV